MTAALLMPSRSQRKRRAPARHLALLAIFACAFLAWYLIAANAVVVASYRFHEAVAKRDSLVGERDVLRAEIAASATPEALEARAEALGFVPVRKATYLAVPMGTAVATR